MQERLKNIDYKKIIRIIVILVVSMRMFCHLFYTTEQEFQIYKDMEIYKAMILFLVILAIYRGITLKDWKAWLFTAVGVLVLLVYFKLKEITPETYGSVYYEFTVYRGIMQMMFVGLLVDLIRHKPYKLKVYLKNYVVLLFVFFVIVFAITNTDSVIPYICPTLALLFTRLSHEDKEEMTYIFSAGTYYAFAKIFTKSLIQSPNEYEGGRYYGSFLNIGSAGACCACALVACIYIFIVYKNKKNRVGLIVSFVLAVYPVIALAMMGSRSVLLGVILMLIGIWVFVHDKGVKVTWIRFAISVGILALMPITFYEISKILLKLTTSGTIDANNLDYFWEHVLAMQTREPNEDMIFEQGTFLYALDAMASTRVSIFAEKLTHIKFTGFNDYSRVGYNSHNFFIANLVRYGILGGVPFIAWFFSCIFKMAGRVKEHKYVIYGIFIFLLMLGTYTTQSLYITCMGGFLLLVTQVFCIEDTSIQ